MGKPRTAIRKDDFLACAGMVVGSRHQLNRASPKTLSKFGFVLVSFIAVSKKKKKRIKKRKKEEKKKIKVVAKKVANTVGSLKFSHF